MTVANAGKVIRTDASRITPENTKILCQSGCTSKSFAEPAVQHFVLVTLCYSIVL